MWQPCELLYTCYLLTYPISSTRPREIPIFSAFRSTLSCLKCTKMNDFDYKYSKLFFEVLPQTSPPAPSPSQPMLHDFPSIFSDLPYFQIAADSCTRGHYAKKLVKSHCHTDARLCFFSLRIINRWNSLSQEIVDAPSENAFKRHLESLRENKASYFMDSQST